MYIYICIYIYVCVCVFICNLFIYMHTYYTFIISYFKCNIVHI